MPVAYTIQPTYAIDDATLLETDLTTCTLLVMIGAGTFSYAVLAPLQRKFLALKSYSYQPRTVAMADLEMIEQIFDADRLLFTAFKRYCSPSPRPKIPWCPVSFTSSSCARNSSRPRSRIRRRTPC